jgi:hypothetical protein
MSQNEKPVEVLSEEQLETVVGGANAPVPQTYLKFELENVLISSFAEGPSPALEPKK